MRANFSYQIVFLGQQDDRVNKIIDLVSARLKDLGLETGAISFLLEANIEQRDPRTPTIGVFLGYGGAVNADHPAIAKFLEDSLILITVVSNLKSVTAEIPEALQHINAIEANTPSWNFDRVASLLLEGFRLLRRERRLFISYKRNDSQSVANQLYEALDARGFDVFIDTRSVPPATDFQAELWHRLSDSDVVVLIDTPGFRSSRWTTQELARANATNIQILHLLWPGQTEDSASSFSHFFSLEIDAFEPTAANSPLTHLKGNALKHICRLAEQLRARAIAARHRYLVDSFCDAARDKGLSPNVQPQRWISIELSSGKELAVVPTIGVPTSERINQVFQAISEAGSGNGGTWVLYDNRGIMSSWVKHLDWLDSYLPAICVKMVNVEGALKGLTP